MHAGQSRLQTASFGHVSRMLTAVAARIGAALMTSGFLGVFLGGCSLFVDTSDLEGTPDAAKPQGHGWDASISDDDAASDASSPASDAALEAGGGGSDDGSGIPISGTGIGVICGAKACIPGVEVCCYSFDAGAVGCAFPHAKRELRSRLPFGQRNHTHVRSERRRELPFGVRVPAERLQRTWL